MDVAIKFTWEHIFKGLIITLNTVLGRIPPQGLRLGLRLGFLGIVFSIATISQRRLPFLPVAVR